MEISTATPTLVGTTGAGKVEAISNNQINLNDILMKYYLQQSEIDVLNRKVSALESENKMLKEQLTATEVPKENTKKIVFVLGSQDKTSHEVSDHADDIFADAEEDPEVEETEVEETEVEKPEVETDFDETKVVSDTEETEIRGPFYGTLVSQKGEDNFFHINLRWFDEGKTCTQEVFHDEFAGFKGTHSVPHLSAGVEFDIQYYLDDKDNVFDIAMANGTLFNAYDSSYKNKNGRLEVEKRGKSNEFYVWVGDQKVPTTPKNFFNKPNIRVSKHFDTSVNDTEVEVRLVQNHSGGTTQFASMVFRRDGKPW